MDIDDTPKTHILCYGDSNTWGYVPGENGARFARNVRWPGVLSKLLRTSHHVTEAGLNGRTTVWDDAFSPGIERNGLKTIGCVLETHKPLDLVILFLGTNDLKSRFHVTAGDIAYGVEMLARTAFNPAFGPGKGRAPDILLMCPPPVWEVESAGGWEFRGAREKSLELREAFRQMAKRTGLPVMYAENCVSSDPSDGIHLSQESHGILGQEVAKWILEWFETRDKRSPGVN